MSEMVMIVTGVPAASVEAVLEAIAIAGGGTIGNYTHCAFTNTGFGRFRPSAMANPNVGEKQVINQVEEMRIESFCERRVAKAVVQAIRRAHPYEEPVIYLIPLLDESEL